ncbi:MAG TPA: hypothetical protein ENK84_12350 [Desulfobulbus sp.]|nr:hypothetical protein [Desulfobulbus sp.]HHD64660.1 hypothetical protein [Desulfobulbaceae bacterium]
MTKICCVCNRVEHGTHWKNDYVFGANERVTHGYCPLCFDVIMAELLESRDELTAVDENGQARSARNRQSVLCA